MIRVCSWRDCSTVLSRYNPLDRCSVHETSGDTKWLAAQLALTPAESASYFDGTWLR